MSSITLDNLLPRDLEASRKKQVQEFEGDKQKRQLRPHEKAQRAKYSRQACHKQANHISE